MLLTIYYVIIQKTIFPLKSEEDVMIKNENYAQNNEVLRKNYGKYGGIRRDNER